MRDNVDRIVLQHIESDTNFKIDKLTSIGGYLVLQKGIDSLSDRNGLVIVD
jgi:hypothetical protein